MLAAALVPALPASAALAQNAGDNQYQDPLGGNGGNSGSGGGGGNSGSGSSTPSSPAQSGGNGSSAPAQPSQAPKATRSVPLARTGFDARIPAAIGLVLLAGGTLLLVRTRRASS